MPIGEGLACSDVVVGNLGESERTLGPLERGASIDTLSPGCGKDSTQPSRAIFNVLLLVSTISQSRMQLMYSVLS